MGEDTDSFPVTEVNSVSVGSGSLSDNHKKREENGSVPKADDPLKSDFTDKAGQVLHLLPKGDKGAR